MLKSTGSKFPNGLLNAVGVDSLITHLLPQAAGARAVRPQMVVPPLETSLEQG